MDYDDLRRRLEEARQNQDPARFIFLLSYFGPEEASDTGEIDRLEHMWTLQYNGLGDNS